ncbi:hypothetical protein SAMN04489844_3226 [Nocardioides exalbidus]|uniref:Uncharacterized protein n=1 Tax=Nocardioides exalbidus TaxID=402596 RepID=A0A1H4WB23_9ACTN|nr:hypothetical protein [Nocardioides exalbidus]SEC90582.1 hypothetical protein SAMN04489844_3226 [Nocardioides exalbidus]
MTDQSQPIDFEKMMCELERSGRERRQIEAQRPSAEAIGTLLAEVIPISRELFDAYRRLRFLSDGLDPDKEYGIRAAPTSLAEADREWLGQHMSFDVPLDSLGQPVNYRAHQLVDPVQCSLDFVQRFVRATMDHLESLAHLVRDDVGFRSTAVLSRAALEAAAAACWLMAPEAPSAERVRRLWNLQLELLTEDVRRKPQDSDDARVQRDEILTAAEGAGFQVRRVRLTERMRMPKVLAEDGEARTNTSDIIEAVLTVDLGRSMWHGLSDVAHSKTSGLMYLDEFSSRDRQIPAMRTESIAFHAMPALLAFTALGDHLEQYLGWDDLSWSEVLEKVLALWHAAHGGSDDVIRKRLGLS